MMFVLAVCFRTFATSGYFHTRAPGQLYPCLGHFWKSDPNGSPYVFHLRPTKAFCASHPQFSKLMPRNCPATMTTTLASMNRDTITPCSKACRTWIYISLYTTLMPFDIWKPLKVFVSSFASIPRTNRL